MNAKQDQTEIPNQLWALIQKFKTEAEELSSDVKVELVKIASGCMKQPVPEFDWIWESDKKPVTQPLGDMMVPGSLSATITISCRAELLIPTQPL